MSDKVKQCLDITNEQPNYAQEIKAIEARMDEISKSISLKSRRSYIGTDRSDQDNAWEKVDSKLDKIYEFQQKIGGLHSDSEEKKQMYNQFGDAIVGLVKNLVKGNQEEKENEIQDFNHIISCLNNSLEHFHKEDMNLDSKFKFNDQIISQERFNKMMERMSDLVKKWVKNDDKGLTRCQTDKERMILSNIESSGEKNFIEDMSNSWNNKFQEIEEELAEVKNRYQSEFDTVNNTLGELQCNVGNWRDSDSKMSGIMQESIKQKFEFFAKNINEIYSLMDIIKKKLKEKSQSKSNEVIFARLNGYGKNIKNLNEVYKKMKEINSFCKKAVIDVSNWFL